MAERYYYKCEFCGERYSEDDCPVLCRECSKTEWHLIRHIDMDHHDRELLRGYSKHVANELNFSYVGGQCNWVAMVDTYLKQRGEL
jgi:Fe-S-cluster-containing dehydrogenase component